MVNKLTNNGCVNSLISFIPFTFSIELFFAHQINQIKSIKWFS